MTTEYTQDAYVWKSQPFFVYKDMPTTASEEKNKNQNASSPDANNNPNSTSQDQDQKQVVWGKVDIVYSAAKKAFLQGTSSIDDVLSSLIATLQEVKNDETQNLGGLGAAPANSNLLGNELDQQPQEQS